MEESDFDQMDQEHVNRMFDDDLYEDEDPIGWYCLGCGQSFDIPVWGYTCPWCEGSAIDAIYE